MSLIEFLIFYLFLTGAEVYTIASYQSGIAIAVPDKIRVILLIFSFKWPKISVLAVIYQVCTYSLLLCLGICYLVPQDFFINALQDVERIFTIAVRTQVTALFLVAMAEEGIYYLKTRQ